MIDLKTNQVIVAVETDDNEKGRCDLCCFYKHCFKHTSEFMACLPRERKDKKHIIFKIVNMPLIGSVL